MPLGGGVVICDVDPDVIERFEGCNRLVRDFLRAETSERTAIVVADALVEIQPRYSQACGLKAVVYHP